MILLIFLTNTDVKGFSLGKVLKRFNDLLHEIVNFLIA